MNRKLVGTLISSGLVLGFAGFSIASSCLVENKKASAATSTTIYFTPDSNWAKDGASFKVGTSDAFSSAQKMTAVSNDVKSSTAGWSGKTIYSYTFKSSEPSSLYFFRCSSDGSAKWNYSHAVSRPSGQYYFEKTADWYDTWTVDQGSWKNNDAIYTADEQTCSQSTGRVFVNNSGSAWGNDGAVCVRAWGGDAGIRGTTPVSASIYNVSWFGDDTNSWYAYADIPTNVSGFQFVLMSGAGKSQSIWNYQKNESFACEANCFTGIYYCTGSAKENINISFGGPKDNKCGKTLLEKVYNAYYSCSADTKNGYPCIGQLENRFYNNASSGDQSSTLVENGSYTVAQKHSQMLAMNNSTKSSARTFIANDSSSTALAVAIPSILTLTTIFGFALKKKKIA